MGGILLLSDLLSEGWEKDWALVYLIGGAVFTFLGIVFGWIVWRKFRAAANTVESQNREAVAQFEDASEKTRRLKSELSRSALD